MPNTTTQPKLAAAIVATWGAVQRIDPLWQQLAGGATSRPVKSCRLRPIQIVDFYPVNGGATHAR